MTKSNESLVNMVGVAVVAILIATVLVLPGCGGGSPTEPKPDPTPVPTPTPGPTPSPTPTPVPGSVAVTVIKTTPASGGSLIVGSTASVDVSISGATTGTFSVAPSEDGISPSPYGSGGGGPLQSRMSIGFTMSRVGKTAAILFYYAPPGGAQKLVSSYPVVLNWTEPTLVVSIGAGGVFTPRDSGTVGNGATITYRNDDTATHQPHSPDSSVVSCPGLFPGEVCTVTARNYSGTPTRISVSDLHATDPLKEVHSFTVSP